MVQQSMPPDKPFKSDEVIELVKHVARHGGVWAAWGKGPATRPRSFWSRATATALMSAACSSS